MRFFIRLLILILFLALGIYFALGRLTGSGVFGEDIFTKRRDALEDKKAVDAETTLRVLKENCGKCHQSTLPTAKPKALAIFDLDKKNWHESVSDEHLEGISRRIVKKDDLSDSDRTAVRDFLTCIRKEVCPDKD